jgi:hypothetical protein
MDGIQLILIDCNGNQQKSFVPVIESENVNVIDNTIHLLEFAPNTKLTNKQYEELIKEYGEEITHRYAETLSDYIASKGLYNKYKDYKATIRNFIKKDNPNGVKPKENAMTPERAAYLKMKAELMNNDTGS